MTVSRRPPVLCATGTAPYRIAYSCVAGVGKCGGQGPILIPNANPLCQHLCPAVLQVHAMISNVISLHLPPLQLSTLSPHFCAFHIPHLVEAAGLKAGGHEQDVCRSRELVAEGLVEAHPSTRLAAE